MLLAGIIDQDVHYKTASLINSILTSTGKKISVVDSKILTGLDYTKLKSYISELDKSNVDFLLLKIDKFDLEKEIFDNLVFDIIIYSYKTDDNIEGKSVCLKTVKRVFKLLSEKGIAIVNMDDKELSDFLREMKNCIVTYGFNSQANMTTSSVGDMMLKDNFMCCLQRSIQTRNGSVIEPQEYALKLGDDSFEPYDVLAAAAFVVINGVDLSKVDITEYKS